MGRRKRERERKGGKKKRGWGERVFHNSSLLSFQDTPPSVLRGNSPLVGCEILTCYRTGEHRPMHMLNNRLQIIPAIQFHLLLSHRNNEFESAEIIGRKNILFSLGLLAIMI